jgi:alcohol dehydrogenase class IV
MTITRFAFPTAITFGAGARKLVAAHLLELGCKRPLIVTDRALAALPVLAEFKSHLGGLDVAVFDGVFGNPTCAQVMAGAAAYKAHGADSVIGFGGGAALDVAKVVGIAATHDGDILEYVWDHPQVRPITQDLPYFVALPTTSGTGSEVGRSSVVSENDTHIKRTVFSAKILAKAVFADPEVTLALPAPITAARCGLGNTRVMGPLAPYGVRVIKSGAGVAGVISRGMKISVCSFTPSRIGIISSRRS